MQTRQNVIRTSWIGILAFSWVSLAIAKPACTLNEKQSVSEAVRLMTPGTQFDPKRAQIILERAEKAGNVDAAFNLGLLHMNGLGVRKSDSAATPYFRKAAECGLTVAQFNLAQILFEDAAKVNEASKWYAMAASDGHAIAAYNLGLMYVRGTGVQKDAAAARKYFGQAAAAGHVNAMYNLGYLYDDTEGTPTDYSQAFRYYYQAAERGHAAAQAKLAALYGLGKGVRKDHKAAMHWLQRAAKNGDADAAAVLRTLGKPERSREAR